MCRSADYCTELGAVPENWSSIAPLPPPKWMDEQLEIFIKAAHQLALGDNPSCLRTLATIKSDEMRDWYVEHGQVSGKHRAKLLGLPRPGELDKGLRDPIRSPARLENHVFERDGYRCRYCGTRVISAKVLKKMIKTLATGEFRRGPRNIDTHGILCIFYPSADHVLPWNLGGRTNMGNLVTSCIPCNFGKDRFTVEEIGIQDPLLREPTRDSWDGLVSLLEKWEKN